MAGQRRFDWLMEQNRRLVFERPEVLGADNLAEIPLNLPLVIVTSHFSDADIQTAVSVLRPKLKAVRTNHGLGVSLQSHNLVDPATAIPIWLVGREHFFKIDTEYNQKTGRLKFTFNPANFREMKQALQDRTDIIIAAHEPLSNIPGSAWALPERSGLGAAYLAQLAGAVLLPVAVDIKTAYPIGMAADITGAVGRLVKGKRASVRVIIGKPFTPDQINEQSIELFEQYISKELLSLDDQKRARLVLKQIIKQSDSIMSKIADLLPAEKRGKWK